MPAIAKKKQKSKEPSILKKAPVLISSKKFAKKIEKKVNENPKGIIFIKHLPHGFYEQQLRQFFEQFGRVTRVYVARSRKTLRSRGYGYVEFLFREVAEIAAESINNYIMFGRIVKTQLLPATARRIPKTFDKAFDENGNETSKYLVWKQNYIKRLNGKVSTAKIVKKKLKTLKKMEDLKKAYSEMGIDFDVDAVTPKYDPGELEYPEEEKKRLEENKKIREQKEEDELSKIQITLDISGECPDETDKDEKLNDGIEIKVAEDTLPIDEDVSSDDDEEDYRELVDEEWDKTLDVDTSVDLETSVIQKSTALEVAKSSKAKFVQKKTEQKPQKDKLLERIMANYGNNEKAGKTEKSKKNKKKNEPPNSDSSPEKENVKSKDKHSRKHLQRGIQKQKPSSDSSPEKENVKSKDKYSRKRLQGGIQKQKSKKKETTQHTTKKSLIKGVQEVSKNSNKNVKVVQGKDFKKKKANKNKK